LYPFNYVSLGGGDISLDELACNQLLQSKCLLKWVLEQNNITSIQSDKRFIELPIGIHPREATGNNGIVLREIISNVTSRRRIEGNVSSWHNNNESFMTDLSKHDAEVSWSLRKNKVLICFNNQYDRVKYLLYALQHCTVCDLCIDNLRYNLTNDNSSHRQYHYAVMNHSVFSRIFVNNDTRSLQDIISAMNDVRLSHRDLWLTFSKYKFVLSPHGNGFDCGRTWEIMLLGSIPVIPYFPGVRGYVRGNLSVITIHKPEDINEQNMKKWVQEYTYDKNNQLNNPHYLSREYWLYKTFYEVL